MGAIKNVYTWLSAYSEGCYDAGICRTNRRVSKDPCKES
jgi:hypothetical protein